MKTLVILIAIVAMLASMLAIAKLTKSTDRGKEATNMLCGLTTGVPVYEYVNDTLYCRTKSGDLQRPTKARFYQSEVDGLIGYLPSPLKNCLKQTK